MPGSPDNSAESIQERLNKARKERESKEQEKGDALAWVTKSRKLEEERKKKRKTQNVVKKRKQAKAAADLLDQYEEAAEEYEGFHLSGLKVAHDTNDFSEDQEIILTLKDSRILTDNNELNDEEDILENITMAESDQWNINQEATKKGYNVYEEIESGDHTDVLKKYDEIRRKDGFRLAGTNTSALSKEERLAEVRKKLGMLGKPKNIEASKKLQYSLEDTVKPVNEYLPQTFKKKRRKKKKSSRSQASASEIQKPVAQPKEIDESEVHHGSRASQAKQKNITAMELKKKQTKAKAYEKAIEKAKMESLSLLNDEENVNEEDNEVYEALKRTRVAVPKKSAIFMNPASIASQVKNRRNRIDASTSNTTDKVLFTSTSEFCRNIEPITEKRKQETPRASVILQTTPNAQKEHTKPDAMEIDDTTSKKAEKSALESVKEEPLVSDGIIATLKLMQQTGDIATVDQVDLYSGRHSDEKVRLDPNDPAPDINLNHYDEYGRVLTVRERFRKLSYAFHGEGPGLNKLEKEKRKQLEVLRMHGLVDSEQDINERVRMEQERTGQAHIELTAAASPAVETKTTKALIPPAIHPEPQTQSITINQNPRTSFQNIPQQKQTASATTATAVAGKKTGKIEFALAGSKRKRIGDSIEGSPNKHSKH